MRQGVGRIRILVGPEISWVLTNHFLNQSNTRPEETTIAVTGVTDNHLRAIRLHQVDADLIDIRISYAGERIAPLRTDYRQRNTQVPRAGLDDFTPGRKMPQPFTFIDQ
ncbi:hypothetical protein D3C85_1367660 [compost metagenome]